MRKTLIVALVLASVAPALAAEKPFYDRVEAKIHEPALWDRLGHPGPAMRSVDWMLGTWTVASNAGSAPPGEPYGVSVVTASLNGTLLEIRDSDDTAEQDLGLLSFNPATEEWTSVGCDRNGDVVVTRGAGWKDDRLVLEGDVLIVGLPVHLRQIVTHVSDRRYTVTNEERMADGSWQPMDNYRYDRK